MSAKDVPRDEVASAIAVRHELGKDYEAEVVEALADRLEKTIDARIDSRLARQQHQPHQPLAIPGGLRKPTVGIALGSIFLGLPITGVAMRAGGAPGVTATIVSWAGIVAVNFLYARRRDRSAS
jgi:hypothetical protein